MIIKTASATGSTLADGDLRLINKLAIKPLTPEEIFAFRVVMADNEIDRDWEAFPARSLAQLAKLFEGRPVIRDHNAKSENQVARIYKTEIASPGGNAKTGEEYAQLIAYCYTPKKGKEGFVTDVEAGVLKEVSVSCSVGGSICSICGKHAGENCEHHRGSTYNRVPCYYKLINPKDAYELSFVPIPAQPAAGIIKTYQRPTGEGETIERDPWIEEIIERVNQTIKNMEVSK